MILIHPPSSTTFRGFRTHTHMASTLPGEEGTAELLVFGKRIGLKAAWLQYRGTPKEHFDVFDGAIDRALAAGALEVHAHEFVRRTVVAKRAPITLPEGGPHGR